MTPMQYYAYLRKMQNYRPLVALSCVLMRYCKDNKELSQRMNKVARYYIKS
jgi:hypothetical protein